MFVYLLLRTLLSYNNFEFFKQIMFSFLEKANILSICYTEYVSNFPPSFLSLIPKGEAKRGGRQSRRRRRKAPLKLFSFFPVQRLAVLGGSFCSAAAFLLITLHGLCLWIEEEGGERRNVGETGEEGFIKYHNTLWLANSFFNIHSKKQTFVRNKIYTVHSSFQVQQNIKEMSWW